jgi:hypothetical protein
LIALERRYLETLPVTALREAHPPLDWGLDARFLTLDRLGVSGKGSAELLRTGMRGVFAALHGLPQFTTDGAMVFTINGDGQQHTLRLGLRGQSAGKGVGALHGSLQGHLPGSRWSTVMPSAARDPLHEALKWHYLTALTGIPSLKTENGENPTLETLMDSLSGYEYQLWVIAEPLDLSEVATLIARARTLIQEIHPFIRAESNRSQSFGTSTGRSQSRDLSESQSDTTGESKGETAQSALAAAGSGLGMSVALAGMAAGLGAASVLVGELVNSGLSAFTGRKSLNSGVNTSRTIAINRGESDSTSDGESATFTASVNREDLNKQAEAVETLLNDLIQRYEQGRAGGFWKVGVYLAAPDESTLLRGEAALKALGSGKDSHLEPIRSLRLTGESPRRALAALTNPVIQFEESRVTHPLGDAYQSLGTPLTSEELGLWINLPNREVSGLSVQQVVHFGVNPPRPEGDSLVLGEVLNPNGGIGRKVAINIDKLSRHTFITGTTGAGKTNTTFQLLRGLWSRGIPFLVIEPAKTEYRALLADSTIGGDLQIFTLGNEQVSPFRLNPFERVPGFGLLTHIDLLKATFNAAFPMYASMPYLLEEAILDVYTLRGWDLATGTAGSAPPTLSDLFLQIDQVVERKQYAQQLRMDLSAALKARISSLRVGSKGSMLDVAYSIPIEAILARPTILELGDLGDDSEKAFVMGLLLTMLYEYRSGHPPTTDRLQHVTIIEEAHRLLKRVSTIDSPEIANPQGRAVETFGNLLAEVREYGEGMIVIDQIATKLAPEIIKNTNLKIIHRVMARDDREEVGGAINLDDAQRGRLVTLKPGEAVIHNDEMDQPLLIRVDHARAQLPKGSLISADQLRAHTAATQAHLREYYQPYTPPAPLVERPGCAYCQARCGYGARMAGAVNPKAASSLLTALQRAGIQDSEGNVNLDALDSVLEKAITWLRKPGDVGHDLKHCLLTHYTEDESVLRRYADHANWAENSPDKN